MTPPLYFLADAARRMRHVFLRDLILPASIGVLPSEHQHQQRIRINLDLAVWEDGEAERRAGIEDLRRVVDYARMAEIVRGIVASGHVKLVETLAERIAHDCLAADPRIQVARVRVEKLDVMPDAFSVGVEIERMQPCAATP